MKPDATPLGGRFYPIDSPAHAPSKYGYYSPVPKIQRIFLDTARTEEKFSIGGSFLWAYKASDISATMGVKVNTQQSDSFEILWGFQFSGLRFSELYITNSAQAGKYIDLLVIDAGEMITTLNPINVTNQVIITKPTGLGTISDVTVVAAAAAAIVAPALATRRSVIITSLAANTQEVRVGDSNTGASRGEPLSPGASVVFETTDAIYAYTGAGVNQTLAITYTTD